jgi:glutamate 5-kinase
MAFKRHDWFKHARRIVVKVGSNVLNHPSGLNIPVMRAISRQICELQRGGRQVVLVSSGAMAAGLKKMGFSRRPDEIPQRQAVSAIGQAGLIMEYEQVFAEFGRKVAQVLLTSDGLHHRKRYLNARNTLHTLLSWNVIPIINENDTVSVEEIKFGDNDNLSAMIALLLNADLLINLTDIDGLYTKDPRTHSDAELIAEVTVIHKEVERLASDIPGALGTGGMIAKIHAAKKVTTAGIPMVIAWGAKPDILKRMFDGEAHGTFFIPKNNQMKNRKRWIGFTTRPKGILRVDRGAETALVQRGKSLLPIGIVAVDGEFGVGAPVAFQNLAGEVLGIGLVNYAAAEIRKIMGLRTDQVRQRLGEKPYDEVIHRDNMAITIEQAD